MCKIMDELFNDERRIMALKLLKKLSDEEIAETTGISLENVKELDMELKPQTT